MTRKAESIVAELRRRIVAGELRPGRALPTAREVMAEFGVSIGPAYRALTMMRQDGLAEPVPEGRGSVVAAGAAEAVQAPPPLPEEGAETRAALVRAAIEIADAEGLGALSMRRLAQRFEVANVWLLTFVRDKAQLQVLMSDAVFAGRPPPETHNSPRETLEALARLQWEMYRAHPWLAVTVSFKHPRLAPHIEAHTAAADPRLTRTVQNFVRGSAMTASTTAFETGLRCLLDGIAAQEAPAG
ncbi:GntR family transcriptional regulator [Dactylosporangium sp. CS-033363]|uniref:GntR family transcriptional regulator n=1 Tax=Dactylosporangium sp. CS-033363 TaxID=3239935 RepID=UPI003D89CD06